MFGLTGGELISIVFLIIIGLSLLGSILSHGGLRNALIWVTIFLGLMMITNNWDSIARDFGGQQTTFTDGRVEVPKGPDNHFRLTLYINNVAVDFLVDTGATQVVLTQDDARRIGLDPDNLAYINSAFTANGEVRTAPVRLDRVELGDIVDTRVRASVNGGEMNGSLLGMSYLSRFESIEIRNDMLILNR